MILITHQAKYAYTKICELRYKQCPMQDDLEPMRGLNFAHVLLKNDFGQDKSCHDLILARYFLMQTYLGLRICLLPTLISYSAKCPLAVLVTYRGPSSAAPIYNLALR